jgi:CBS domain containing-hemolysin-like protein
MIELMIAISFAIVLSAGCSLFKALLYSVLLRYIETLVHEKKISGKIFRALRADIDKPVTAILSLSKHLTLEAASRAAPSWEHGRFPVYDKNTEDIVGIVLTRELFMALSEDKDDVTLQDLMRPARFIVESAKLSTVLMEFMGSRHKLFIVIDEYGGLTGVITLEDVLEDILGREIIDESDRVADKQEFAGSHRGK